MKDQNRNDGFRHSDPTLDEALDWFVRLEANPHDQAIQQKFRLWYDQCPEHQQAFDSIRAVWTSPDLAAALTNHQQRADRPSKAITRYRLRFGRRMRQLALSTAAVFVAGIYLYPIVLIQIEADYSTTTGQQQLVTLPDGSSALLNTASAIAVDFSHGRRNVKLLQGEVFFEVVHDSDHPFIVGGRFSDAEVKGTAFAVETNTDMDRVILERGRVAVRQSQRPADSVELTPDEMVTAFADHLSPVEKTDAAEDLAWRNGRINFSSERLGVVVGSLRRYYRGVIIIASRHIADTPVSGSIRIDDPQNALRSLAETAGASLTRLPGGVMILR